ncbi:MAG: hypothetical protein ACI97A_000466 [Planctomycetota bacterium]|jgi:hypothetical protein
MNVRLTLVLVVLMAPFFLGACTTSYKRDGKDIPADFAEASLEETDAVDFDKERIDSAVEAVGFERGPSLLQNLQWLIAQKDMAVPAVAAHLPEGDLRTKANLLYVLGFTRTEESTAALVAHMNHEEDVVRYEAAAGLLNHGDTTAVPVLVDFLDNKDRRFRFKAIQILKQEIGKDFGYQFSADQETRQASIGKWQDWWSKQKKQLMYRPKDK